MAHTHEEPTYDSPSAFFEAMDYTDATASAQSMLNYNQAPQFENPFKPNSRFNGAIDPMLSSSQMNSFTLDSNFWHDPAQFGALETNNTTLSPLGANQSCDTGYVSQEGSSKSPPMDTTSQGHANMAAKNSFSKARKRSSTKSTISKTSASASVSDSKPARKARRTSKASTDAQLDNFEDDEKREQFLARNREAASKCRQKKKEWTQDLEQKARDLSSQKQMLTTYLAMLKNELLMLKCKCLEHSDCGCDGIRDYLKNTVNTMPPANAALYSRLENKDAANDIAGEVARKQSSATTFDLDGLSPQAEGMVTSPSSAGGDDAGADILRFESELQEAATG